MTRLALLPENDIANRVKAVLAEIEALKTAQAIGGDSIQRYSIQTGNAWDVILAVPAGIHTYRWRVTMAADHPDRLPYSEFEAFASWTPTGTNQSMTWSDAAEGLPYDGNRQMHVDFFNLSGEATTLKLQFVFNSGDTGTLSWVQLL